MNNMGTRWTADTIQYLTLKEMRRFDKAITSKRDRAIFLIAYEHGLRSSEVGMLRVEDVNLNTHIIHIHRMKESLSGRRYMQFHEEQALESYLSERTSNAPALFLSRRNEPISRRMLDVLMKTYGAKANIPEAKRHFHVLRHSIAIHLLDAGEDIHIVKRWVGHASISNTMIYAQLINRRRDEEARKI